MLYSDDKKQAKIERAIKRYLKEYPKHQIRYVLNALRHPEQAPEPPKPRKYAPWTPREQEIVDTWEGTRAELARFLGRPRRTVYRHL